jgi:predicted pyridoxine 5'-phosphate oxidase superfamily flavin-nucleotide-binding protein
MNLTEEMVDMLINAEGKALATYVPGCLHVVPVSTVRMENNKIILVNYFMGKTLENIQENPDVSLTYWRDLDGFQVKAHVRYLTEGVLFDDVVSWVAEILPERTVRGVLELTPYEVYDVSATIERPGSKVL